MKLSPFSTLARRAVSHRFVGQYSATPDHAPWRDPTDAAPFVIATHVRWFALAHVSTDALTPSAERSRPIQSA